MYRCQRNVSKLFPVNLRPLHSYWIYMKSFSFFFFLEKTERRLLSAAQISCARRPPVAFA